MVYLAFHRQGARNEQWSEALWPSRTPAPSTLHSTASDARRALGRAPHGGEHLPRSGRRLRLEDSVGTDVERFARLASATDPGRWQEALALIRGPLFEGLNQTDWAVFDGTQARVESMVVATALKGAQHHMVNGSGRDSEWMIRQAMRVNPYDERLHRALLRAAESQGNRVGLRTAMHQLLALATDAGDPVARSTPGKMSGGVAVSLHPQTVALYRELCSGGMPTARGHPVRL